MMHRPHASFFGALAALGSGLFGSTIFPVDETPDHQRRGNKNHLKPSRYSGEEIRRLNAERGVGSINRVDPAVRANFIRSPR